MIDLSIAKKYFKKSYLPDIESEYGDRGGICLRIVFDFLNKLYQEIEPSEFLKSIIVFKSLEDDKTKDLGISEKVTHLAEIKRFQEKNIVIEILEGYNFRVWVREPDIISELNHDSIVYQYKNRSEHFFTKTKKIEVEKIDYDFPSMFAIPTFTVLDRAISMYKVDNARRAKCDHLKKCMDKNRIYFYPGPENAMQVSLHSYLDNTLRFSDSNVKVTREVNTGLSYPVDVKVFWINSNKSALIEIKWIGISYREKDWKRTGFYMGASATKRVNSGNKQIAQYLENNKDSDYYPSTIGYYVIFDGRRHNVRKEMTEIKKEDGFFYENAELIFSTEYHKVRNDFREPIRIFIEPICLD